MEQWFRSKWFAGLVYALLSLGVIYMLMLIGPVFAGLFAFLKAVLVPFIVALILSYVLNPIVGALHHRKVPRTVAVLLIYAVFVLAVMVVLMNVIPMFVTQLTELNEHLPEFTMRAQSLIIDLNRNDFLPESVRMGINNALYEAEQQLAEWTSRAIGRLGSTVGAMFAAFLVPFLAFYMLKDFQVIEKTVLTLVPEKHKRSTVRLVSDIDKALGNYIRGQFIVCVIIGVFAYIGYWLIGVPYPLLLAAIVGLFNIIPYVGPFFGAAPAIVVASTVSLKMVLLVIAVNFACQILEGNVVSPQVVGRSLHMHPMLIIFALLVGGELGGIVGLILAVPLFAVAKVVFHHVYLYYKHRRPVT
ncbi:AI-2E family transporter [Paenibacillus sp.]|uniref:AI-2E family transporter n=1 Tax=Paenibacillus sp. TaxID=58172 RepID=UPI002D44893C|nr:AI-2E family transporter [Paenibacillus sp.]HZG56408.1 AI-2E family transporter [Paenibacillus sp.]